MDKNITIYKANKFYNVLLLIVPFLLLIPLFESESIEGKKLFGYGILSLTAVILAATPLAIKLEITKDSVRSYFFGFCVKELRPSNIQSITYGNLFRGGLGFGKGLIIYANVKGKSTRFSMGEMLYGKKAIQHAKRVLEQGIKDNR